MAVAQSAHVDTRSAGTRPAEADPAVKRPWRVALRLLSKRQAALFVWLSAARSAVGFCDLALAVAMYVLFLLVQGHAPAHSFLRTSITTLDAALLTSALVVVRTAVDIVSSRMAFGYIQGQHTDFLLRLTQGYSEMDWNQLAGRNRSELTSRALHTTREAADFYHRSIELVSGGVIITAMTVACFYQSSLAALGFACTLAAFYFAHRLIIRKRVQQAALKRETAQAALQRTIADMLRSGKEIRTYGNRAFFRDRIYRLADKFGTGNRSAVLLPQVARSFADQGTMLIFLGLIAAAELIHGDTSRLLSLLAFYFVLSRRLLPLVSQTSLIAGQMESSFENVRIVDADLEECRRYRMAPLPVLLPAAGFILQVENVSFSFDRQTPLLREINLVVGPGEIVVLHGPSGEGKTTLLNLIAGITLPDSGVVRVNRTVSGSGVAYVPQEVPLLDDTIRENLLFGLPSRSDQELTKALAAARLEDFVAALPRGLETRVGDDGALFSGGERQRLGLARAILRGSQLLVLDEATSAMDEENERQVLMNLGEMGMAVILVTHRRQARFFAQRVYRIQGGVLMEDRDSILREAAEDRPGIFETSDAAQVSGAVVLANARGASTRCRKFAVAANFDQ
jgi:ABC-type multidrug transport system fused ATPase/permease subunit